MDRMFCAVCQKISIHTPVKGVTRLWRRRAYRICISIHTPVKGVTTRLPRYPLTRTDFNPHTREGCDSGFGRCITTPQISIHTPVKGVTCGGFLWGSLSSISIHTPVKGVTVDSYLSDHVAKDFNPHTREGCDLSDAWYSLILRLFQSTHP